MSRNLVCSLGPTIQDRPEYAHALASSNLRAPRIGEVFQLTIDGCKVDPMDMVKRDRGDPKNFIFLGPSVCGIQTHRFKLIVLEEESGSESVIHHSHCRRLVTKLGCRLAEGQWREPFLQKFPRDNEFENGPVHFAGSLWEMKQSKETPQLNGTIWWPQLCSMTPGWHLDFMWDSGSYLTPDNLRIAERWLVIID